MLKGLSGVALARPRDGFVWHAYESRWPAIVELWRKGLKGSGLELVRESTLDPPPGIRDRQLVLEELRLGAGDPSPDRGAAHRARRQRAVRQLLLGLAHAAAGPVLQPELGVRLVKLRELADLRGAPRRASRSERHDAAGIEPSEGFKSPWRASTSVQK